jgi:hypothetical protein
VKLVYIPDHILISFCHHQKENLALQLVKARHHYNEENKEGQALEHDPEMYPTSGELCYQGKSHIHFVYYVLMLLFHEFPHIEY